LLISFNSRVILNRIICGVQVIRNERVKLGIRISPYCEVRGKPEELKVLQEELLGISVTSALRPKFLRISGIENCHMMTSFIKSENKQWFLEVVKRFKRGDHLTRKGILQIMAIRPVPKNKGLRVTSADIIQTIMEK